MYHWISLPRQCYLICDVLSTRSSPVRHPTFIMYVRKPGPAVVTYPPLLILTISIMHPSASPNKRSRSEKEEKLNHREQGWRRMALRLLMVLANALRQLVVGHKEPHQHHLPPSGGNDQTPRPGGKQLKDSIEEILDESSSEEASGAETEAPSTAGSFV